YARDVWMIERGCDSSLANEACCKCSFGFPQDLDRTKRIGACVACPIDGTHSTKTEKRNDDVVATNDRARLELTRCMRRGGHSAQPLSIPIELRHPCARSPRSRAFIHSNGKCASHVFRRSKARCAIGMK